MQINQVEELCGISKKNIRFYEEQGLLKPKRNPANGYRDYSLSDVESLQRIKLFRSLELPLDAIRSMSEGSKELKECLFEHISSLEEKRQRLEIVQKMCKELSLKEVSASKLNPAEYLEEMRKMEEKGVKFMDVERYDVRKGALGSVLSAVIIILPFLLVPVSIVRGMFTGYVAVNPFSIIFVAIMALPICSVAYVLKQRLSELKGGEIYEASKY